MISNFFLLDKINQQMVDQHSYLIDSNDVQIDTAILLSKQENMYCHLHAKNGNLETEVKSNESLFS